MTWIHPRTWLLAGTRNGDEAQGEQDNDAVTHSETRGDAKPADAAEDKANCDATKDSQTPSHLGWVEFPS